jgi:uncharacterized protein (TIGR02453 family)
MLQPATLAFLDKLAKNNNKVWFDANRNQYVAAKEDVEALAGEVLSGLAAHDDAYKEQKAKDCVMRIFRDVRFSNDKTPYKTNFGAGFSAGGRKSPGGGFYLHLEPGGKSFAGGGMWQPESPMLKAVRQEIDYNFREFSDIIEDKKFKKMFGKIEGEQLKKLPLGYAEDNPAIEYLKMKSFIVSYNFPDDELTKKGAAKKIIEVYTTMKPFIDFLNRAVA